MKKAISIILVLTMLLSLIACSNKTPESSESNTEAGQNTTLNETTEGKISEFVPPENYATVLLVAINPQIRLYLDADGNVLAVEPVNKDAKKIVEQLSAEDVYYTEAIEKIVSKANENGFIKSTTVVHIEISETKDNPVDKDEVSNEISEVVNQIAPGLKLQVKVKVKEAQPSEETTATISPGAEETTVPTTEPTTPPAEDPAPTQCSHAYKNATCAAPKTCSKCGATEGSALGHSYKDATCTAPKTCSKCGTTEGNALGHSYKNATCTTPKTCSKCGTTEGNALGHSYKNATCTTPKTCSKCGETDGSILGHNYIDGNCTRCKKQQENYHAINSGVWLATQITDGAEWDAYDIQLNIEKCHLTIGFGRDINALDPEFKEELLDSYYEGFEDVKLIDGVYYYFGAGDGGSITYTASGNTISINCENDVRLTLERIAGDQLKIVNIQGDEMPTGIVLKWSSN